MNTFVLCGFTAVIAVLLQYVFPGRALYHYGWFNVGIAALVVAMLMQLRKLMNSTEKRRARTGFAALAFGVALVAIAGITSGLLAPDPQRVVGSPGQSVRIDELGRPLDFPLIENVATSPLVGTHISGGFLLRSFPRTVVAIDVFDPHGAHLTITQPSGNAFLSPVLMMETTQKIAGLNLPYDSFSVPAAKRVVKAVLFTAQQAAQLPGLGAPAVTVLFDVENDSEAQLAHGITFAHDGESKAIAGIVIRPTILEYPALEIVAIPNVYVTLLGLLAIVAGIALQVTAARTPSRS